MWVGDPNGYTPMNDIPEFVKDGVGKVQGGTYPAKIWRAFMDAALVNACRTRLAGAAGADTPSRCASTCPATSASAKLLAPPPGDPNATVDTSVEAPTTTVAAATVATIDSGTTIAPDVLDPRAPLPATGTDTFVFDCAHGPIAAIPTTSTSTTTTAPTDTVPPETDPTTVDTVEPEPPTTDPPASEPPGTTG